MLVLTVLSRMQPIRGWLRDLLAERYLLAFVIPLFTLFGWPIENLEAFREGEELGWQRIARIALFGVFVVAFVWRTVRLGHFVVPRALTLRIFAVYAVVCGLSALYSPEPLQTLWKAIELIVLLMFALRLYDSSDDPMQRAARLANSLMYIAFSLCVFSLVGGALAPDVAWRDYGLGGIASRSMSGVAPVVNANMLGQLGGIVTVVALFEAMSAPKRLQRGYLIALAIGLLTLILAYARTSLIASALIAFALMIRFKRLGLLSVAILVAATLAAIFPDAIWRYLSRGQEADHFYSMSGRTNMWEFALKAFEARPLLGHGFFVGHKYVELGTSGRFLATADSTYVETLVNLGVVGFVLVVAFALSAGLQAMRVLRLSSASTRPKEPATVILFAFCAFILVRSLTASSFQVLHYNLVFLLVAIVALLLLERGAKLRLSGVS